MILRNLIPIFLNLFATSVKEKILFGIVKTVNIISVKVAEMKKLEISSQLENNANKDMMLNLKESNLELNNAVFANQMLIKDFIVKLVKRWNVMFVMSLNYGKNVDLVINFL